MTENQGWRTEAEKNAYAHGVADGWDHQNCAAAYGDDDEADTANLRAEDRYAESDLRAAYAAGWAEGVQRYANGQWADGEPKED